MVAGRTTFRPGKDTITNRDIHLLYKDVLNDINTVANIPWVKGRMITALTVATQGNNTTIALAAGITSNIEHGLGRAYQGWKVVDVDAAARIFRDTTSVLDPARWIAIQSDANVNVRLLVW